MTFAIVLTVIIVSWLVSKSDWYISVSNPCFRLEAQVCWTELALYISFNIFIINNCILHRTVGWKWIFIHPINQSAQRGSQSFRGSNENCLIGESKRVWRAHQCSSGISSSHSNHNMRRDKICIQTSLNDPP